MYQFGIKGRRVRDYISAGKIKVHFIDELLLLRTESPPWGWRSIVFAAANTCSTNRRGCMNSWSNQENPPRSTG
jgi:hypothetical protein